MTPPPTPITDPGVTVATGDPDSIASAGAWHPKLASTLESHSSLIKSTAGVLLTGWTGDASKQYQSLSATMAGHYEVTAAEARAVGSALKKFSAELGSAQGEGRGALKNAIHWMNEVNDWQNKLSAAEKAKAAAEARVKTAMQAVVAANHAAMAPQTSPHAGAAVTQANNNLNAARNALAKAQNDEATATKNLKNSADHFTMWQKKGGKALEEAEKAGGGAGLARGAGQLGGAVPGGCGRDGHGHGQRQHHRGSGRRVGPGLRGRAGQRDRQRRLEPAGWHRRGGRAGRRGGRRRRQRPVRPQRHRRQRQRLGVRRCPGQRLRVGQSRPGLGVRPRRRQRRGRSPGQRFGRRLGAQDRVLLERRRHARAGPRRRRVGGRRSVEGRQGSQQSH